MKVTVCVEKGKDLFSCVMHCDELDFGVCGDGATARKAVSDFLAGNDEMKAFYEEEGKEYPDLEFEYRFDIGSLFDYYSYLNISEVGKRIGITPSLMRKYAAGVCTPSDKRLREIEDGLQSLANELSGVRLCAYRETAEDRRIESKIKELYG